MRVSFVETMRGTVRDEAGRSWPVEFEVRAEAADHARFLRDGTTRLEGLIRAGEIVPEAACQGSLTLSPLRRRIAYALEFSDAAGAPRTLRGEKRFDPLSPVRSMTVLPVELAERDGRVLARGELRFDLRELLPFLASWLPIPTQAGRRLDRRRRALGLG